MILFASLPLSFRPQTSCGVTSNGGGIEKGERGKEEKNIRRMKREWEDENEGG